MTLDVTKYIEDLGDSDGEYAKIIKKVKKDLKDLGIVPDKMPIDEHGDIIRPTMPPALGDLHYSELINLLASYGAYDGYVVYQLGLYRIEEDRASKSFGDIKAQIRLSLEGSPTSKSDRMITDRRHSKADRREFEIKAKRILTEAVQQGTEKSFFTVSRAITAQQGDKDRSDRDHKVGGGVPQDKKVDAFEKLRRRARGRRG